MWHVTSRSGVATWRTAIHLLLTYLLTPKEVTYSMLEGAYPAQATVGSVAGGRPSYHSNCGRVARSV